MRYFLFSLIILIGLSFSVTAQDGMDLHDFSRIPVQHEGRIKPLSRFAEIEMEKLAGSAHSHDAVEWLAEALFDPQRAAERKIIRIDSEPLRARFNLPVRTDKKYSLAELTGPLSRTHEQALALATGANKDLPEEQKEFLELHEKALAYGQILQAMSAFLPWEIEAPSSLEINYGIYKDKLSFIDLRKKEQTINEIVQDIITRKGDDPQKYSVEEQAIALLSFEYHTLRQAGGQNIFFRVIPPSWGEHETWLAPWELLTSGEGGPQSAALVTAWQGMAHSWHTGDAEAWTDASRRAYETALASSSDKGLSFRLEAERLYAQLHPIHMAFFLYLAAACLLGLNFAKPHLRLFAPACLLAGGGALLHGAGIAGRMVILGRPPVGSLYESLLFVSLVIIIAAFLAARRRKDRLALVSGLGAALLVLFISPAIAPQGDNLEVLVAVLNTNFWLATHVICITAGYGVCVLASVMAHFYLYRPVDDLKRNIYILSLFALLLTAAGTVLGGIWADQSWGRFWGWDPKENGALLIVLWLLWLLHGKMGGQLRDIAFHAGLAFLNVIVALSWFGVNLLNVGLHSYGFTSGLALGLGLFCGLETLAIGALYFRAIRKGMTCET